MTMDRNLGGATAITPGTGAANLGKAEDGTHTSGDVGVAVWGVQKTAIGALAADGKYAALQLDNNGFLRTAMMLGNQGVYLDRLLYDAGDDVSFSNVSTLAAVAALYAYDGGASGRGDRLRTGSATNMSSTTQNWGLTVQDPGEWTVNHAPAANTQATASKSAGAAGVRHVCTGISIGLVAGASAPTAATVTFNLRDGASGAGSVLRTWILGVQAVAGSGQHVVVPMNVFGSAATAMTIEATGAGGANTLEYVSASGYSTI